MAIIANVANRVNMNPKELERFLKFMVVGVIGAVVDFGTYNLLLNLFSPSVAGTISFVLAILSNFVWNRYWTYPDSRSKPLARQFVQFFLVNVSGIVIRWPILRFTHELFTELVSKVGFLADSAERLGPNISLALAVGIVMFWNFFVNRYWTYNDVK